MQTDSTLLSFCIQIILVFISVDEESSFTEKVGIVGIEKVGIIQKA